MFLSILSPHSMPLFQALIVRLIFCLKPPSEVNDVNFEFYEELRPFDWTG